MAARLILPIKIKHLIHVVGPLKSTKYDLAAFRSKVVYILK